MDKSFDALLSRLESLAEEFRELHAEVRIAVVVAETAPALSLTQARKVLEQVVRDVYERRVQEPPGTRPLENLIQRLFKDGHFPERLEAYATTVRKLGNLGTHNFTEKPTVADVYQSLSQLMPILEWYFKCERPQATKPTGVPVSGGAPQADSLRGSDAKPLDTAKRDAAPLAIVPKGLRSFDASDADFFLDLLPGPRDKEGLPESIRFWKHRIEAQDERTFTVGVLNGPSGCGKSSLVKAGLPRLAPTVHAVYVEASAADTEARLLASLRRNCPNLAAELSLVEAITFVRACAMTSGWA